MRENKRLNRNRDYINAMELKEKELKDSQIP